MKTVVICNSILQMKVSSTQPEGLEEISEVWEDNSVDVIKVLQTHICLETTYLAQTVQGTMPSAYSTSTEQWMGSGSLLKRQLSMPKLFQLIYCCKWGNETWQESFWPSICLEYKSEATLLWCIQGSCAASLHCSKSNSVHPKRTTLSNHNWRFAISICW